MGRRVDLTSSTVDAEEVADAIFVQLDKFYEECALDSFERRALRGEIVDLLERSADLAEERFDSAYYTGYDTGYDEGRTAGYSEGQADIIDDIRDFAEGLK